jgi:hypothetical protein
MKLLTRLKAVSEIKTQERQKKKKKKKPAEV